MLNVVSCMKSVPKTFPGFHYLGKILTDKALSL